MEILFLGGAQEVGSSCILVKLNSGINFIIDCGIKINETGIDKLPNFNMLQEECKNVDFIVVSHAHMDHTGALPQLLKLYPAVPIYMTKPTFQITYTLLEDSVKVMELRDNDIPIYDLEDIEKCMEYVKTVNDNEIIRPVPGIALKFIKAGHILGATSVVIQTEEGSIVYTGDIMLNKQLTVDGADEEALKGLKDKPNVLILETTYGARQHPRRKDEEEKLFDVVVKTIESGGKVLIPAFAVGRAQEVLFLLKNKMKATKKKFDVYVDGMVKQINNLYTSNVEYVSERLKKAIFSDLHPFYDDNITPVSSQKQREEILKRDEPYVVVASSGMLTGGASVIYAEELLKDKKNTLIITGYQDEESPGRQLLKLAEEEIADNEHIIGLNGKQIKVEARILKCSLSAHADAVQLESIINSTKPENVILNHGDAENITAFYDRICNKSHDVYIPENGEKIRLSFVKPTTVIITKQIPSMGIEEIPTRENISRLWEYLLENNMSGHTFTIHELAQIWCSGREDYEKYIKDVLSVTEYFQHIGKYMYRVRSREEYDEITSPKPLEQNELRNFLMSRLADFHIRKVSLDAENKKAVLHFITPYKIMKYKDKIIPELEKETLWKFEISNSIDSSRIMEEIKEQLPFEISAVVRLDFSTPPCIRLKNDDLPDEYVAVIKEILNKYELQLATKNNTVPQSQNRPKILARSFNEVKEIIEKRFKDIGETRLCKVSLVNDVIYLKFINPAVAERYKDKIGELFSDIPEWEIHVDESYTNMAHMTEYIKFVCKKYGVVIENPSYNNPAREVYIKTASNNLEILDKVKNEIENYLEFKVVWKMIS